MSDEPKTHKMWHEILSAPDDYEEWSKVKKLWDFATQLERENAALREDKARLDWLAVSETWFDEPATESFTPETFRAAIDAARKEAQP